MLVSFNPSLSIPNVNRKNPDKTSFQMLPEPLLNNLFARKTIFTKEVDMLRLHLGDRGTITTTVLESLIKKATPSAQGMLEALKKDHPRSILSA